ncbi:MAG: Alpha-2-macroglobulin protein, partial [uncultured bacterium]
MRGGFGRVLSGVFIGLILSLPSTVLAEDLIPTKRFVLSENTDLPGGDISSIFDTTLEACQRACLTNRLCEAFTFNTRNGSCFPKSSVGEAAAFNGAYSGYVLAAEPGAEARAKARRAELNFVMDWEISAITEQAAQLANSHTTNGYTAEEHLASAADAEANGDYSWAS